MTKTTIRSLAASLLLTLVPALSASDDSVDDPILGQWAGVVISDATVDSALGYIALAIGIQHNRLHEGLIGLAPPNPVPPPNPGYPTDPTRLLLSASGTVSLTSQTDDWTLDAQGALEGNSLS